MGKNKLPGAGISEQYVSGFDFIKVFGCCLIAASHSFVNPFMARIGVQVTLFLGEMVPVFFLMSGYLMALSLKRKPNPKQYIAKYILKYAYIYYAVCLAYCVIHYYGIWKSLGIVMYKDFLYVMVTFPVLNTGGPAQMWFVPPLLAGIWISGNVMIHKKERRYQTILYVLAAVIIAEQVFSGLLVRVAPWLYTGRWMEAAQGFLSRYIRGLLFVWIGSRIYCYRERFLNYSVRKWIPVLLIFSGMEALQFYRVSVFVLRDVELSFTAVIWSVLFMKPVLQIHLPKLKNWHMEITLFSGLMYFLHMEEQLVLDPFISNRILVFLTYTAFNLVLTEMICVCLRRKGKKYEICRSAAEEKKR